MNFSGRGRVTVLLLVAALAIAPDARAGGASGTSVTRDRGLSGTAATGVTGLDMSSKELVKAAYESEFSGPPVETGWNGSVAGCKAGTTSDAHRSAVLRRINFYRSLAGLDTVRYDDSLSAAAQEAALVGAAEGRITHELPASARCYTALAAEGAATSNLALGVVGSAAVDAYMDDGIGLVGHRTWLLSPTLTAIATGDVVSPPANAIRVTVGHATVGRSRDGFVAYPSPGWFPAPLVHQSWSIHHVEADFSAARVSVSTSAGQDVPARIVYSGRDVFPSLVFVPDTSTVRSLITKDETIRVVASGVIVGGQQRTFTYEVSVFVPNRAPVSQEMVTVKVPRCARAGRLLSRALYSDPDGDQLAFKVAPVGSSPAVLSVSQGGLKTLRPIDPSWSTLRYTVTVADAAGLETGMAVNLVPEGPRACSTLLPPMTLPSSSRHGVATLMPEPRGRVVWSAAGKCRKVGASVHLMAGRGSCTLTATATTGSSKWTIKRQVTIGG